MGGGIADRIFSVTGEEDFSDLALEVFRYQAAKNPVYSEYLSLLGILPNSVTRIGDIPFLPVDFFRQHKVYCGNKEPGLVFESSGTTSGRTSRHYVLDPDLYRESIKRGFNQFYGDPGNYCILALLPSPGERKNSSLAFMAAELICQGRSPGSGFYLSNQPALLEQIEDLETSGQAGLLMGLSYYLADLAESQAMELRHTLVMETGGMKGRRREMTREELHALLEKGMGTGSIHSEYGMTELLSQAWSSGGGIFHTPPWMKVTIRDPYDPFSPVKGEASGGINIIDLANVHSCSFLSTQDIGRTTRDGGFMVLGRFDHSDLRGCNLMVE